MKPTQPCHWCASNRFGFVNDLKMDVICDAKVSRGNVLDQHFSALVCVQCGAMQLFATRTLLEELPHEVVTVVPDASYR